MCSNQDEPWPPIPPDMTSSDMDARQMLENPCQPFVAHQHQLYKSKDGNLVFKMSTVQREYDLHKAAGDCAIALRGRVLSTNQWAGSIDLDGYFMDFATPIEHTSTAPAQRKQIIREMVHAVEKIHEKHIIHGDIKLDNMLLDRQGHLRLCDFEEGLFEDEDEETWNGNVTWHYVSPNRRHREEQLGHDAPPRIEDDIYGLGLSIWALYTGKIPFEEIAEDDLGLREVLLRGDTVDVELIDDDEIRETVKGFLRQGGAHI
ncbi:kinase-like domain-containing protein [Diaporthe sp. PMI_573]|nr:kinase-like domain-containing protein [Diaporthaceae sp. PMI_573]